ncbi:hypothetical protein GCM10008957_18880 [Deinococcus ruber]|uniref:Uncharacterized protein n=1 Tax=Deinococcus ruber TaxID=1848197 RepID=A0A918F3Y2_9DEIO|nr:hypothetical protein GCM10008957_18880 [Deinococcus ruber]
MSSGTEKSKTAVSSGMSTPKTAVSSGTKKSKTAVSSGIKEGKTAVSSGTSMSRHTRDFGAFYTGRHGGFWKFTLRTAVSSGSREGKLTPIKAIHIFRITQQRQKSHLGQETAVSSGKSGATEDPGCNKL